MQPVAGAQLWQTYRFRGSVVRVVQQWQDPFGRKMVRVEAVGAEDAAAGMPEAAFLREAVEQGGADG